MLGGRADGGSRSRSFSVAESPATPPRIQQHPEQWGGGAAGPTSLAPKASFSPRHLGYSIDGFCELLYNSGKRASSEFKSIAAIRLQVPSVYLLSGLCS
ncbi:unnamed protein product [Cylicocyclus nassatus]|uniref:Uncharacterized protein n=1 Tax=Cylicocyclus nassatus TaxID=53992 RepID=A0AA36MHC7_CYLNA|nr:unnamed protein product [Cylicocyclus nassatus]